MREPESACAHQRLEPIGWLREPAECNQLRGTDGDSFAPLMGSPAHLEVFSADLCGRLTLNFAGRASFKGLSVDRYVLDGTSWQSFERNPANKCYCLQRAAAAAAAEC